MRLAQARCMVLPVSMWLRALCELAPMQAFRSLLRHQTGAGYNNRCACKCFHCVQGNASACMPNSADTCVNKATVSRRVACTDCVPRYTMSVARPQMGPCGRIVRLQIGTDTCQAISSPLSIQPPKPAFDGQSAKDRWEELGHAIRSTCVRFTTVRAAIREAYLVAGFFVTNRRC